MASSVSSWWSAGLIATGVAFASLSVSLVFTVRENERAFAAARAARVVAEPPQIELAPEKPAASAAPEVAPAPIVEPAPSSSAAPEPSASADAGVPEADAPDAGAPAHAAKHTAGKAAPKGKQPYRPNNQVYVKKRYTP